MGSSCIAITLRQKISYLLRQITVEVAGATASVNDNDGEFLLIEVRNASIKNSLPHCPSHLRTRKIVQISRAVVF
jgi:hypothetical protein